MPKKPTFEKVELTIVPDHKVEPRRTYANFAAIDHTAFDFTIRFCDVAPPAVPEKTARDAPETEYRVPIVAEIVIPFQMVPGLIKALKSQYEKFQMITNASNKREAANAEKNE